MSWLSNLTDGLKKAISDKTLSNLKDYHMPVMTFMFVCGCAIAVFKPAAMTMAFVAFTGTIVGGITGHAFSPAQRDQDVTPIVSSTDPNSPGGK